MSGKEMTVEEVMSEILQDRGYYRNSGGGVTLSGGEVSTQPEFAVELLKALKNENISTAIETNLYAPWSVYESLMPFVDLVMFDIRFLTAVLIKNGPESVTSASWKMRKELRIPENPIWCGLRLSQA